MNVHDGPVDIRGVRGLGGEKLSAAFYALLPKPDKRSFFSLSERDRDFVACFLHSAQMCLCQTADRRRPLRTTGRLVNTAVRGPALNAISIHAAVVYVPLLLCARWRQHTDCALPSLLLKPGNTPYPCPAWEARAPVCRTWLTK